MTDDIMTRLGTPDDCIRELLSGCVCNFIGDGNCRCCRAAEMIEHLRTELESYQVPQRIRNAKAMWNEMGFGDD